MKRIFNTATDILLYVIVFVMIQLSMSIAVNVLFHGQLTLASTLVLLGGSSLLTITLFLAFRWTRVDFTFLRRSPWQTLLWTALMPLGLLFPLTALQDLMQTEAPEELERIQQMLSEYSLDILLMGILAPITEEMVFRGGVLKRLLREKMKVGVAIFISAALFGMIHGNMAQFINATLMGMLIGYIYVCTGSIAATITFHCVNNTAICIVTRLIPNANNITMVDFAGSPANYALYMLLSIAFFLFTLRQFNKSIKKQ